MHHLGAGEEVDAPAGLAEAVAPVGLLAEHEEVLVEESDLVRGVAPDEQAGTEEPVDLAHLVVVETALVEGVQRTRARRQLAQEEVLGREPPQRRKGARGALQRPVGVEQPRPDDGRIRVLVGEPRQLRDAVAGDPGIRVQQQEVAAGGEPHPGVVAAAHADVLLLDHARFREPPPDDLQRLVGRAVVDHDRLVTAHALEAALDPLRRVEGDDDDGDVRHRAGGEGRAGRRGSSPRGRSRAPAARARC